jgi:hypothetical protein
MLESALYQLHDKETLNLEFTPADARVLASALRRVAGPAQKEASILAGRLTEELAASTDPRRSVSAPFPADKVCEAHTFELSSSAVYGCSFLRTLADCKRETLFSHSFSR